MRPRQFRARDFHARFSCRRAVRAHHNGNAASASKPAVKFFQRLAARRFAREFFAHARILPTPRITAEFLEVVRRATGARAARRAARWPDILQHHAHSCRAHPLGVPKQEHRGLPASFVGEWEGCREGVRRSASGGKKNLDPREVSMVINLRPQAAHNGRLTALSLAVSLACTPAVLYAQARCGGRCRRRGSHRDRHRHGHARHRPRRLHQLFAGAGAERRRTRVRRPPDLMNALANVVPSFTAQAFGGDMANQTLQAKMRGLSPNHTLVLVNGKRRHTTASLAILGGPYQGGAGVDLNFIPVDSIDHVEVLTEGAAAQYGTDAIAGVINIIMKKQPVGRRRELLAWRRTTPATARPARYSRQHRLRGHERLVPQLRRANIASTSTPIAATSTRASSTRRASIRTRAARSRTRTCRSRRAIRISTRSLATPPTRSNCVSFNAGIPHRRQRRALCASATWGDKHAASFENYRLPNRVAYTDPDTEEVDLLPSLRLQPARRNRGDRLPGHARASRARSARGTGTVLDLRQGRDRHVHARLGQRVAVSRTPARRR